jgi:hypothetical protein
VPPLKEIVVELGTAASQAASEENSTTLACAALEEIRPRKMDEAPTQPNHFDMPHSSQNSTTRSMNFVTKGAEVNFDLIKGPAASGC